MMVSPVCMRPRRACTVFSVGSPDGTMIHAARGGFSLLTRSSSEVEATAPSPAILFTASALRSDTTMVWPPRIRRRVILAPMRPRPTIPNCIAAPQTAIKGSYIPCGPDSRRQLQSLFYQCCQLRESCSYVAAEVHAQRAAIAVGQNLEVSASLCRFHHSESVLLSGDGQVLGVVARDLQEH